MRLPAFYIFVVAVININIIKSSKLFILQEKEGKRRTEQEISNGKVIYS